jgi:hypothetical protein
MKGMAVEQVLLIFICVAVVFGILIWYWQTYVKGSAVFTQADCQTALTMHCNEYKTNGYPTSIYARFFCKKGNPQACCATGQDGYDGKYFDVAGYKWWDCIAPGCRLSYDIKIGSINDCP